MSTSSFIQIKEIKDILGICDSSDDWRLWVILDSVTDQIFSQVWNLIEWEKKELFPVKMESIRKWILPISVINVSQITKICKTDFTTMVAGEDYQINDDGTVQVLNLSDYIDTEFDKFEVKYIAGYKKAPADLVNIIATLVGLEFSKDLWKDVIEETTWPRTVKWSDPSRWQGWADAAQKSAASRLRKYIPVHLRIF